MQSDILYIESRAKKVEIHTKTDMVAAYAAIGELEKQLVGNFYRCHRGYLVNMAFITGYGNDSITLNNGETVILSKDKYSEFVYYVVYKSLKMVIKNYKNKDHLVWIENLEDMGEICHYAVADLDRNGRYEIIVSGMGGTGRYSYSRVFEINENYDGLVECTTEFVDEGSEPDISISEKWTTYMDDNGEFHYVVYDWVRNGISESYQSVMELTLQNGKIMTKLIANKITTFSDDTSAVICTDLEGNAITEEEYENVAKKYFAGCQERTTCFGWQDVKELGNATEEIVTQLDTSLNIFLYHEP